MSSGLLASARLTAATETEIYTVAASYKAIVNVTISNASGSTTALVRIGVQDTAGAFAAKDYLLYDYPITFNSFPIQLTGIALDAGQSIRAYSDTATVNIHVNGIEEAA